MEFRQACEALIAAGRELHSRGWVPATSGNFSARLEDGSVAITLSGRDKGSLSRGDIGRVDLDGQPLGDGQPSAETLLHAQLYGRDPEVGAVLHTHSLFASLASTYGGPTIRFENLEILKAFSGTTSHESVLLLPVFANSQDMAGLASEVEGHMQRHGQGYAYLIKGHGTYTWGATVTDCLRHLEALEFLLQYHWYSEALGADR